MSVVFQVVALSLVPVLMFGLLWLLLLAPGRYRAVVAAPVAVPWRAFWRRFRRPRPQTPDLPVDPFAALSVQLALGRLSAELELLSEQDKVYARGFRLAATQAAYDDVLEQACVLAKVPLQRNRAESRQVGRLLEEAALADRGWI